MALKDHVEEAIKGMRQAIYLELDRKLSPPLQEVIDLADGEVKEKAQDALDKARIGWDTLASAIATGVINGMIKHIEANMEIFGINVQGEVTTTIKGETSPIDPDNLTNHQHAVNLSGTAEEVVFKQNNDDTGHVR